MNFLPINLAGAELPVGFDYPAGMYRFKIESAEIRTNKSGDGQHAFIVNIIQMGPQTESKYNGKKAFRRYALTEKAAGFLKRLYIACGYSEQQLASAGANVTLDWLIGREYIGQIIITKDNGNRDITNERPLESWNEAIAAAGGPQAQVQKVAQPSMLQPIQAPPAAQAPPQQQYQQYQAPQMAQTQPQYQVPQYQQSQTVPQQPQFQAPQFPSPQMAPQQQQSINPFPAPVPPPGQVG